MTPVIFFNAIRLQSLDKSRESWYHNKKGLSGGSMAETGMLTTGIAILVLVELLVIEEPLLVGRRPR